MAKAPAFQWYPRDYLTDEAVVRMSLEQRGAYVQLLSHQWLEGSIPADMPGLAALCGINPARMKAIWPGIAPKFEPTADGRLRNARLEVARQQKDKWRERQSEGGKVGADKRWHSDKSGMGQPIGPPITNPMGSDSLAVCSLQFATALVTDAVSNETGGEAASLEIPFLSDKSLHGYFMPLLRELNYEADDHDGSILKALDAKGVPHEELENAIRGLALMRKAGELERPMHIPPDGKLSLRILYTPKLGKFEAQPWWNRALQAYWKDLERGSRGLRKVSL